MALQQNFGTPSMNFQYNGDVSHKQKWNSLSQSATTTENLNGCFDCNICLDSSHDPVVTLCGHLYCWPCIYKWLQVQTTSLESEDRPKCPVCKANISTSSLVPLYGRGTSSDSEGKKPQLDLVVPQRPRALGMNAILANQQNHRNQTRNREFHNQQQYISSHPFSSYTSMAPSFGGPTSTLSSPTINMVGEMVFARMFGSSDSNLFAYPYSNSYPFSGGNGSPRLRRHEMQLDKSLNRVSIFLFCCIILCLVLF